MTVSQDYTTVIFIMEDGDCSGHLLSWADGVMIMKTV